LIAVGLRSAARDAEAARRVIQHGIVPLNQVKSGKEKRRVSNECTGDGATCANADQSK
jgi:hypothetical protein